MQTLTVHKVSATANGERASVTFGSPREKPAPNAQSVLPVDYGFTLAAEVQQRSVKGEDTYFSYRSDPRLLGRPMPEARTGPLESWSLNYDVFVVCDGHSGTAAWEFVEKQFLQTLDPLMPRTLPPSFKGPAGQQYAAALRTALSQTLVALNQGFNALGNLSGCTCTILLVAGNLLTLANIGDSDALLDVFNDTIIMSTPHRVQDNEDERQRVIDAGATIAPLSQQMDGPARASEPGLGPLRIWPGGLCVSRGIGDIDVGHMVIALPSIRQVIVPPWGARCVLASDGLWDCITFRMVISTMRGKGTASAALALVQKCLRVRQGALIDDTTCFVVDMLPHGVETFKGYSPDKFLLNGNNTAKSAPAPGSVELERDASRSRTMTVPQPSVRGPLEASDGDESAFENGNSNAFGGSLQQAREGPSTRPRRPRTSKSAGCLCCMAPPPHSDGEDDNLGAPLEAARRPTATAAAGGATNGSVRDGMLQSQASLSGSTSRSVKLKGGGAKKLGARRKTALVPVELLADVDMAFQDAFALPTVSETTAADSTHHEKGADGEPDMSGGSAQRADSEFAEMSFEPDRRGTAHVSRHVEDAARWHTVPFTETDFTTRPHKDMYDTRRMAVPLPPLD